MKRSLANTLRRIADRLSPQYTPDVNRLEFSEWKCGFCGAAMTEDFPFEHVRNVAGVVPCVGR